MVYNNRHYNFELEKTLYFFTAGRYEFSNKGADIFIEALARLNHYLKVSWQTDGTSNGSKTVKYRVDRQIRVQNDFWFQSANSDMTVVAFLIFPARTDNFNVESLRGHAVTKSLRDTILEIQTKIGRRIYEICLRHA